MKLVCRVQENQILSQTEKGKVSNARAPCHHAPRATMDAEMAHARAQTAILYKDRVSPARTASSTASPNVEWSNIGLPRPRTEPY